MIVTRAPLRISFFGGGTDYPESLPWLRDGGATLSTTIDKYSYVSLAPLAPLFDFRYRVSYSAIEFTQEIAEIKHPAVRECLRFMRVDEPLEIHAINDLPARTGLGSSSSFTVACLHALHARRNEAVDRLALAREAVHVEREMIPERVGLQDQYACAHGGFLHMRFHPDRVEVEPLPVPEARLDALRGRLMLFYTGIRRTAHEVLEEQMARTTEGHVQAELTALARLVDEARGLLEGDGDLDGFGELLHEGWTLKRRLSSAVSSPPIDDCYASARRAGAVGGKLLGAGGGGFLLFYVPVARQDEVRRQLGSLREVRFDFEREGSSLVFAS